MNNEHIKNKALSIIGAIKNYIILISKGEANFNVMLYLWGVLPGLIITIFLQLRINSIVNIFFAVLVPSIILIYFLWHFFAIRKALKVHPEYVVKKIKKKELYAGKTDEEIEEIKKEKRKETLQKMFLLRGWESKPAYVLIEFFDLYLILTQIQVLLKIFR